MSPWRGTFWRTYWNALQRSRRDRRARSHAWRVTAFLLLLLAYAVLLLIPLGQPGGGWLYVFYLISFGAAILVRFLLNRSNRKQSEMLKYSITGAVDPAPREPTDISHSVRTYISERTLILASLIVRGASEVLIHQRSLSRSQAETRQTQNAFLRNRGLWEKLEAPERELASLADGSWTIEQQFGVASWCEQLRLLRWLLHVDAELMPLAHFPKVDLTLGGDLSSAVAEASNKQILSKVADLRVERENALGYLARAVAELRARGLVPLDAGPEGWGDELRQRLLGASSDLWVGAKTVADLDDESLRSFVRVAAARERYAGYLLDQLSAAEPLSFSVWSTLGDVH